jgi:hypothetical protein
MRQSPPTHAPLMEPSAATTEEELRLAREQGEATRKAFVYFTSKHGGESREESVGDYVIGCVVGPAEGFYRRPESRLEWRAPEAGENAHIDVSVRDGADGRFVPGLMVLATVIDGEGRELGTHRQPFVWHPWIYHYGRNWRLAGDGKYAIRVRIEPPDFPRRDRINGRRYADAVEVEFADVAVTTGRSEE